VRKRVVVAVAVIVIAIAALVSVRSCRHSSSTATTSSTATSGSAASGGDAISRPKRARTGPVQAATLSGRVTKASDGSGIPGAVVSVVRAELLSQFLAMGEAPLVAVTDARGAWSLTPVLPGTYFVAASALGFLPSTRAKLVVDSGEQKTGIDLALDAGGTVVSGTVSDIGGGGVADARISFKRDDTIDFTSGPDFVTISKPDGTYAISLPPASYDARAAHDEYRTASHDVEVGADPVKLDFTLPPGGIVRVTVVARDSGASVPGAFIVAQKGAKMGGEPLLGRADESGAFVLRGLPSGAISISAQGPSYASRTPTVVELAIGEEVDGVRVVVDRAFDVYGNVVRKGKPAEGVAGIQLGVFPLGTVQYGIALEPTDAQGPFVFPGPKPAPYTPFAGGDANVPSIGTNVEVVDTDVTGVVVEMEAGVTLSGRVEPPVAGARLSLVLTGAIGIANLFQAAKSALVSAETDAQGRFIVRSAPAGAFTLIAKAPTGETGKLPLVIGEKDIANLVVKLEPRASIAGRVVDDKGAAVAGARVDLEKKREESDDRAEVSFSMNDRGTSATTTADGSFKIVGLEPGTYTPDVSRMKLVGKPTSVTVAAGQAVTGVTVTVEANDGVIRGQVIGADKRPVADAWVNAELTTAGAATADRADDDEGDAPRGNWFNARPVMTASDGRFTLDKLQRGTYKVSADGPRGASHGAAEGIKTGSTVTITLAALGTISGKVTSGGKPVAVFDISCDGPGAPDFQQFTSPDGSYSFERLTPGRYSCTVHSDAGSAKDSIEVPAGPVAHDFTLAPWATIVGNVVDVLSKKPVPNVLVLAGDFDQQTIQDLFTDKTPKTDVNGHFSLARIGAGSGNIIITEKSGSFSAPLAMKPYTVTQGQTLDLGTIEVVAPRTGDAGTFGFGTTIESGKLLVASVKDGGPAQLAGLQPQDEITAINGTPVATLTPEVAQKLVSSGIVGVGVTVQLTLSRGGAPVTVAIVSVKW